MIQTANGPENPGLLPAGFQFSQTSLQDYLDCRRRFQLRYMAGLSWPAAESEPALAHERYIQQGIDLHHLIHQYLLGIPRDLLENARMAPELRLWWDDFLKFAGEQSIPGAGLAWPERSLSTRCGTSRIVAKYDLVLRKPDSHLIIYDWKTSQRPPNPRAILGRVQKRLYPYLLVKAGAELNGGAPVQPEKVAMAFWYTSQPLTALVFSYSQAEFEKDRAYVEGLIDEINQLPADQFFLTSDLKRCGFCTYRSLCRRGERAESHQNWLEQAGEAGPPDFQIDLDLIPELDL